MLDGQFNFLMNHGFDVLTVSADGPEIESLKRMGISHRVVPMTRQITPLRDVRSLVLLIRVMIQYRPTIVHTHTPKAGLLGLIAAWLCRVPVRLHTVAGLPLMESRGLKRCLLFFTEKITYACAQGVYPNSRGLLDFMRENLHAKSSRFKVIGSGSSNGIDVKKFTRSQQLKDRADAIRAKYKITSNETVFCFVGRIVFDKGITELVSAFKLLSEARPSRLILVGPFEQALNPLPQPVVDFINSDPRVIAPGFQADVRPWLLAADVFVFPSYREGFPNVVMQAACLEVPAIVSDINGCNELIENGVTGWVVPPKTIEPLHHAMEKMADDKALRRRMALGACQFVHTHFDQQRIWNNILDEYQTCVNRWSSKH
ncbi:MAG: glycosyltransferase family 4 protein [Bacteroidota bacterium]